jgi:anti-anti-sigma regulatory factor
MLRLVDEHAPAGEPGSTRVVRLPAAVDLDSAGQVRAALAGALAAGVTVLIADMTATAYCSLEGVHALLRARRAAEASGERSCGWRPCGPPCSAPWR